MSKLEQLLGLRARPIAISFTSQPPAGVPHVAQAEPAGCGYWRRAAGGEVFYTQAADHVSCPVGAHTHSAPLTEAQKQELEGLVKTMIGLQYLAPEDVAQIPTMPKPLEVAVYAPLDRAPVPPD